MSVSAAARGRRISLGQLHLGQSKAHWALQPHRFKALRCGRRFGKTEFAKTWIAQGLVQGEDPARCDAVFAVIDTASKTGTDNDATAVTFFAYDAIGSILLFVLDWDVVQIEGAMLET